MNFSLGLVEVSALGHAIAMLDEMVKVANVEFVAVERKLGGRLVTIVVKGSVSAVTASVDAGRKFAENLGVLKSAEVIANPHPEILKFIHLDKNEEKEPNSESAATHTGSVAKKPTPKSSTKKATSKTKSQTSKKVSDIKKSPKGTKKVK